MTIKSTLKTTIETDEDLKKHTTKLPGRRTTDTIERFHVVRWSSNCGARAQPCHSTYICNPPISLRPTIVLSQYAAVMVQC